MIQFENVTFSLPGRVLFEEASFTIGAGERCGLLGRNGSGKSTLLRLINGDLDSDKGVINIPRGYKIGYLQQHIHFKTHSLLEEVSSALPEDQKEDVYQAEKILFGLGFTDADLESVPTTFSGGYQLRIHLAKVLVSQPDCLLLDEPTNYLDILSMRWLKQFLTRWQGEFIIISHDRDFLDSVTTHTMGIHREKIKKMKGSTLDFFNQVLLEEELHEKARLKSDKKREHLQDYIDRFGAKASKATQAQSKMKMLAREPVLEKLNALAQLNFSFRQAPFPGKKMLEAKQVQFSYAEPLIENFSLEIEKGDRVAIIGKNGRGKSTLLRLLCGDLAPLKGSLEASHNLKMGYFGQTHVERLNQGHTIEEEIGNANPHLNTAQIKAVAGMMMFSRDDAAKKIGVLSGGERARVLLAKILGKECNLLLLDEPTHHLDIESIEALMDALEDFSGSIVMVTHSELILQRLNLNKIVLCSYDKTPKQTLFLGNYDEFLEKVGWEQESRQVKRERAGDSRQKTPQKQLEKRMSECEKKILILEEKMKKNQNLIESGTFSPEVLKLFASQQKELAELEHELYRLYEEKEKK